MIEITQIEKTILLGGLDITVSTLSNMLNNSQKEEEREMLRSKISETLNLSVKVGRLVPSDLPKKK
jgi:hypothetical protein